MRPLRSEIRVWEEIRVCPGSDMHFETKACHTFFCNSLMKQSFTMQKRGSVYWLCVNQQFTTE